jgi:hypothetical protein
MSKLLKKDGKLAKQGGKLVVTDDPAKCPCCNPIDCTCADSSNLHINANTDFSDMDNPKVAYLIDWSPPDTCNESDFDFDIEYRDKDGNKTGGTTQPATKGQTQGSVTMPGFPGLCSQPEGQIHSVAVRLVPRSASCQPGDWVEAGVMGADYESNCPPPPPCQPAPDCQDAFVSKAQCNGKEEAWVNCSNNDCTANDFQEAKCLEGLPEALESQGWNVVVRNEQCCECGPTGPEDGTQLMNVFACCEGTVDGLVANFIYIPRNEDDPCQWCTGLSGVEATFKDGKPVWSIQRCTPPQPCGDCVPIPEMTDLKLEVRGEPGKEEVCVLATAQWTPPDGCYASDQEARDKVSIVFEFLDKDREVIQSIGGPANIGENIVGYCSSLVPACDPSSPKAEFARAKAVSDECESEWSREFGLPGGSASWEDICKPPQPDGYICQGPFSQIWECAPCNECAGQPEVYATMEECQAACKPPDPRCLPPAICTWSPPDCGGECWLDAVWDDSDPLPPAYCASRPYDCTSKSACEAWVQANPNPPCVGRQEENPLP